MSPPNTCTIILPSARATAEFATNLAPALKPGDTILLAGDLGTGKTHFARALIQARLAVSGRTEDVPSPTYTLVQPYWDGSCDIWHTDLFRLTHPDEVIELGLLDALDSCICLIEWPDRMGDLRPENALSIQLHYYGNENARRAEISWIAPRWNALLPKMEAAGV